jgi:hypothetical protein
MREAKNEKQRAKRVKEEGGLRDTKPGTLSFTGKYPNLSIIRRFYLHHPLKLKEITFNR